MITKLLFIYTILVTFITGNCSMPVKLHCTTSKSAIRKSFVIHSSLYFERIPILWKCLFVDEGELNRCLEHVNYNETVEIEYDLFGHEAWNKLQVMTKYNFRRVLEDEEGDELCELLHRHYEAQIDDTENFNSSITANYIIEGDLLVYESSSLQEPPISSSGVNSPVIAHPSNAKIANLILLNHEMFFGLLIILPLIIFSLLSIWMNEI